MTFIAKYTLFFIAIVFFLFSSHAPADELGIHPWFVYSSIGAPATAKKHQFPVDGSYVASIQAPLLPFPEDHEDNRINFNYFGKLDYYYLAQTVNCSRYKGRHFHISNYALLDTTAVRLHIRKYANWVINNHKKQFALENKEIPKEYLDPENYIRRFDHLFDRTESSLVVFVTTTKGTSSFSSNNKFLANSKQWQRFNVEVDVPDDCRSMTIATFFKGLGNLSVDDYVISERGNNTAIGSEGSTTNRYGEKFENMLNMWIQKTKNNTVFENMGFEESNKTP